ncbi:MAG: hypothetical protein CSA33_04180 [Desulfobulbus propionicus]|nr:MAG: hypothetical protein CSA33_04180 [Desulfobulbus propionicus]
MNNQIMRDPLLKAGAILILVILLIYLTSTSADGSVFGAIGLIFLRILQLIQWAIGMVIGIVVCMAVLFGIFLCSVAMVDRESSRRMYHQLKMMLKLRLAEGAAWVMSWGQVREDSAEMQPEKEAQPAVAGESAEAVQSPLEIRLEALAEKMQALESKLGGYATHQTVEEVSGSVLASEEAVCKKLEALESKLEGYVPQEKVAEISGAATAVEEAVCKKLAALESKLEGYVPQEKVAEISGAATAVEEAVHQKLEALESKLEGYVSQEKVAEISGAVTAAEEAVHQKLEAFASKLEGYAPHQKVEALSGAVTALEDAMHQLHQNLAEIKGKLEEASGRVETLSAETILGDLPGRVASMEQQDVASKEDVSALASLIEELQGQLRDTIESVEVPAEKDTAPVEQEDGSVEERSRKEHRLLAYFDDPADQEKLRQLVEETLKKDMTYAQVMEYLVKSMGSEKGQIIADHPSLAKDFIRQRRRA